MSGREVTADDSTQEKGMAKGVSRCVFGVLS